MLLWPDSRQGQVDLKCPPSSLISIVKRMSAIQLNSESCRFFKNQLSASLVAQWLRIRLPVQGIWVRALVREDPTCCGAPRPVCHNY